MGLNMHKGAILDKVNGYSILDCNVCGFAHIDPIPTDAELDKIYSNEYYSEEKPDFIDNALEDKEWWRVVFDSRYDQFETGLLKERRELLDIGCGPGLFLERGMERGWNVLGIEPSLQAAAYAKGLGVDVVTSVLDSELAARLIKEGRLFDAIHISEVLEHVADPALLLTLALTLLKPGGVICAVVPNDYSPVQRVLSDRLRFAPYWLAPPYHINYFNFNSFSALLERAGFNIIKKSTTFPIDLFLLMGENYVGNDKLGRICHAKRKRLEILLETPELKKFKDELYSLMATHSIGREMVIYGRK